MNEATGDIVSRALAEDVGTGDVTTDSLVAPDCRAEGRIIAVNSCVICGIRIAVRVFRTLDPDMKILDSCRDGKHVDAGETVLVLEGNARAMLTGERTALNFMQRMSGISTLAARFAEKTSGHNVAILDTRKTTPNLRELEKYAVRCGGGTNHRMGLYDRVLIKDNHISLMPNAGEISMADTVSLFRRKHPELVIEVEADTEQQVDEIIAARPDWILVDNMPTETVARCVRKCAGICKVEASGGITLDNIESMARTGVDAISLGCLTHSAPSADLSMAVNRIEDGSRRR